MLLKQLKFEYKNILFGIPYVKYPLQNVFDVCEISIMYLFADNKKNLFQKH